MKAEKNYHLESDYEEKPLSHASSSNNNNNKATSSASSDFQNCPICLCSFESDTLVSLDVCAHKFCFECIQEWSKKINTCPIDRRAYNYLEVRQQNKTVKRIKVEDRTNIAETEGDVANDFTFCEICHLSNREDRMLLCDGCDRGFHCECLNPPIGDIPSGDWYCPRCVDIRASLNGSMSQSQAATSSQQSFTDSSFLAERVIARTNYAERVRRSVNETRRNRGETTTTSVYSLYSSQTPTTSTARAAAAGSTTRGRKTTSRKTTKRKSTTVKRRRRGRTTKRKKPQRRRKRRVTTKTTKRKTTTTTKTTSLLNKTLKNRVTSRKVKRRRKSKYRKRRPATLKTGALSSVGRRTIKLNAITIKRKVLDRAKQRLLTKYIKRDEERRGMDWSQPSMNASLNNVTTDLMSDYIPLNVSAPDEITTARLAFESRPMTSQQANNQIKPCTSKQSNENTSAASSSSLFESILSDIKLLNKKSGEIQVKTDGSLNLIEKNNNNNKKTTTKHLNPMSSKSSSNHPNTITSSAAPPSRSSSVSSSTSSSIKTELKHTKSDPNPNKMVVKQEEAARHVRVDKPMETAAAATKPSTSKSITQPISPEPSLIAASVVKLEDTASSSSHSSLPHRDSIKTERRDSFSHHEQAVASEDTDCKLNIQLGTQPTSRSRSSSDAGLSYGEKMIKKEKSYGFIDVEDQANQSVIILEDETSSTTSSLSMAPHRRRDSQQSKSQSSPKSSICTATTNNHKASAGLFSRDRIAEISKQALKPYYMKKLIDKDTYKLILKKVVTKTESHLESGSHMSAERIAKLTVAYAEQLSLKKKT